MKAKNYILKGKVSKAILTLVMLSMIALKSQAQLAPFQSMFYQNRYLLNPAFAGTDQGLVVNINYQQQWTGFPGTPKTGLFTGDYAATDKVGLGLNVVNEEAGIIRTTRILGSYAYHVQLNATNSSKLNFGLSLGLNNSRVDYNRLVGDAVDGQVAQYNALKPYIDGDLGAAYTNEHLTLSATMPNISSTILNTSDSRFTADQLLFVGLAAYKFPLQSDANFTAEPLVSYRIVKGYKDIIDAGLNFSMVSAGFNVLAIYHSNQTVALGAGLTTKSFGIVFNYNLETGAISQFTNGAFELGLRLHVL